MILSVEYIVIYYCNEIRIYYFFVSEAGFEGRLI